mgnify:FL=1
MALTTVSNAGLGGSIDLTAKVTGTLPIANGGTNSTSTTFVNAATNMTGTLPIANGGTAITSGFVNGVANPGKIGQVFQVTNTTQYSSTSVTYIDMGLSQAITPVATSSKILIMAGLSWYSSGVQTLGFKMFKDASELVEFYYGSYAGSVSDWMGSRVIYHLDSPSTTSATTYKMQFARVQGAGTSYSPYRDSNSGANEGTYMIVMEVLA